MTWLDAQGGRCDCLGGHWGWPGPRAQSQATTLHRVGTQGVVHGWDGGSHFSSRVGWKLVERKELGLKPQDTH